MHVYIYILNSGIEKSCLVFVHMKEFWYNPSHTKSPDRSMAV